MKKVVISVFFSLIATANSCTQRIDHDIFAKGIYISDNAHEALEMATLVAQENLAKQFSAVLQEEDSEIENESFRSTITTSFRSVLQGYAIASKRYDRNTRKAEVVLKIDASRARSILCNSKK